MHTGRHDRTCENCGKTQIWEIDAPEPDVGIFNYQCGLSDIEYLIERGKLTGKVEDYCQCEMSDDEMDDLSIKVSQEIEDEEAEYWESVADRIEQQHKSEFDDIKDW